MALINGIYIFVQSEDDSYSSELTSHPVEKGLNISDHMSKNPITLEISGQLVDYGKIKYEDVKNKLIDFKNKGTLISYIGRTILNNCVIKNIKTSYSNAIDGGCTFSASLEEIRVATTSYLAPISKTPVKSSTILSTQQVQANSIVNKVYHIVKAGDSRGSLATKYNSTIDFITKNNPNIKDWLHLKVGEKLYVANR